MSLATSGTFLTLRMERVLVLDLDEMELRDSIMIFLGPMWFVFVTYSR